MAQNELYAELTERNIGLLNQKEQDKLRDSCIAVFGIGGLGGVVAEVLCRSGIGHLKIIEPTTFEPSNLNRQIFCFRSTIGQKKNDAAEKFLKDINPQLVLEKYDLDTSDNIDEILTGVNVAILAVDKARSCLLVSRETRARNIPLVESWAIPFTNVRVYTKDTITLEEAYRLHSKDKKFEEVTEADFKKINLDMLKCLRDDIEGLSKYYMNPVAIKKILLNQNTSFAPMVWQNAVLMSLEAIKILLGWGNTALAPRFALYDPFLNKLPGQKINKGE